MSSAEATMYFIMAHVAGYAQTEPFLGGTTAYVPMEHNSAKTEVTKDVALITSSIFTDGIMYSPVGDALETLPIIIVGDVTSVRRIGTFPATHVVQEDGIAPTAFPVVEMESTMLVLINVVQTITIMIGREIYVLRIKKVI